MDAALLPYRLSIMEVARLKRTLRDIIHSYSADCREKYPVARVSYQFFNRMGYYQDIVKNQIKQLLSSVKGIRPRQGLFLGYLQKIEIQLECIP